LRELRGFRQREHLRIAARDLARLASLSQSTRELAEVADLCLAGVLRIVRAQVASRFGEPWEEDGTGGWRPTPFCVIGLGKLGGLELNYSSDVDLLFVYGAEGRVFRDPPRSGQPVPGGGLSNHAFFQRLAEAFVTEVQRTAPEGQLYRVDLRLRPEGETGPLARSIESYENYYAQWGQTWERLMLLKARTVAGDRQLGAEFIELIQPFRYPRSLSHRLLEEIAATKHRLETEVVQGDAERDVKRGRGGIREIEFVVQSLQLLNGGRQPFLQGPATLPALDKLAEYDLLERSEARQLAEAYRFWRDAEHRLQIEHYRQTHTLPVSPEGRERIARLMDHRDVASFETRRLSHARAVRAVYDKFLGSQRGANAEAGAALPGDFTQQADAWQAWLTLHGFRQPLQSAKLLQTFVHGPGWSHVSSRTEELARTLLSHFFALCPRSPLARPSVSRVRGVLSDPDRVLVCLDRFATAYGSRAPLYETWTSQPLFFELVSWLFDRSDFLAQAAIRTPDLAEELVLSGRLRRVKSVAETLADLRHGRADSDQALWLRRYQQAEQLRLGLRSILEYTDTAESGAELNTLADACLQYALEVLQQRHRLATPPFAVFGLGKLGGSEPSFGSDLDLLFVASDSVPDLSRLQPLAAEFLQLLSAMTDLGQAFETDTRLRPDGEKGLLVNTTTAHLEYYRRRAQLWELQALSRLRFIAGEASVGARFSTAARRLTDFSAGNPGVAAWSRGWRGEIQRMLQRIVQERTPAGRDAEAFKTGTGGLIAAEFLAQTWCLAQGWTEPNTRAALVRGIADGQVSAARGKALLAGYDELRRVEAILRRWSGQPEELLPDDPAAFERVAVRCGYPGSAEFHTALATARQAIESASGRPTRTRRSTPPGAPPPPSPPKAPRSTARGGGKRREDCQAPDTG
jgi:glutamate-ammonia-ligase adenylyltransferase